MKNAEAAIAALAAETGVGPDTVRLAASFKVAAVLTGSDALGDDGRSWRELVARVATSEGRAEAERVRQEAAAQGHVGPDRAEGYVRTVLERMTGSPDEAHDEHGLVAGEELAATLAASAGPVRALPDRRFHELFEERVRRHPDAVAAVQAGRSWTYAELNRRANRIARSLRRQGLADEDVVAVVAERSLEWMAAVIAVFKAGGCYLPLDPAFPAERISVVLERSGCRRVLADPGLAQLDEAVRGRGRGRGGEVTVSVLTEMPTEVPAEVAAPESDEDLGLAVRADQLAYIYFTSGSTGEPKGAMCEHAGFLNHLYAKIEDLGVREGDVIAQTAPQCFDISLWQLVCALLVGGRTEIIGQETVTDVRRFVETVTRAGVQVAQLVPSYLDLVLETLQDDRLGLPSLRCLAVTGEALKAELVHRWFAAFPGIPLVNCYGTTEVSDDTNHGVLRRPPVGRAVPLGPPTRNVRVYVVDERLRMVPDGAPGEIVFAGVCVGRGYVNDAARTDAAYRPDPYRSGERLYRSGDFGRRLPSGEFEYLGRRDSQVKVSGFRIEIGEIENRLLQVPGVRDGAVVIAGSAEDPQLVGFYSGAAAPEPGAVDRALAAVLPHYMVPGRLHRLARLPLSANGKIDKKALTAEARAQGRPAADGDVVLPETDTERRVARLWAELLDVPLDQVGRGSRFVELGGTSLAAIRLAIALDRAVTVGELKATPTVAEVAGLLDRKAAGRSTEARR
ncbi:amino acid adenylation domain-containing protein [Kitasatospora sp. NPDC085464]|uniref:amino acid adenylation domain-containing protein n=1 Tax=Kitasatospora sp. NPDC085464 TaxID=3364063 RepID=UPI0037C6DFA2